MTDEKNTLRKSLKEKRSLLTADYRKAADEALEASALRFCTEQTAKSVFCFVGTAQEINTLPLINKLLESQIKVCVPRCAQKGVMQAIWITDTSQLETGAYGILEPKAGCTAAQSSEIDICLVPCLAVAENGVRLGYGGGYYDRFLAKAHMPKAALCYSPFILSELPADKWDVKMDYIISETGCTAANLCNADKL